MTLKRSKVEAAALKLKSDKGFCTDDTTMKEAALEILGELGVEVEDDTKVEYPWNERWFKDYTDMMSVRPESLGGHKESDWFTGNRAKVEGPNLEELNSFLSALVEHHNKTLEILDHKGTSGPNHAYEFRFKELREHYGLTP